MKAQMKQANKLNAKYAVILGDDEIAEGAALIRSMADSSQEKVAFDAVIEKIKG